MALFVFRAGISARSKTHATVLMGTVYLQRSDNPLSENNTCQEFFFFVYITSNESILTFVKCFNFFTNWFHMFESAIPLCTRQNKLFMVFIFYVRTRFPLGLENGKAFSSQRKRILNRLKKPRKITQNTAKLMESQWFSPSQPQPVLFAVEPQPQCFFFPQLPVNKRKSKPKN